MKRSGLFKKKPESVHFSPKIALTPVFTQGREMIVYKYLVAARIDVLENGNIRFTQPGALNDPFEALPDYTKYKDQVWMRFCNHLNRPYECLTATERSQANKAFDEVWAETLETFNHHFAFLSLTKERNNLLMWSHYTEAHKGFVLGMDSDSPFFKPGNGKSIEGLREVFYTKKRHVMPKDGLAGLPAIQIRQANAELFFTKSPEWSYEKELRVLADPKQADVTISAVDGRYDICLCIYPREAVREIILGYRMEKANKDKIIDVLRSKYPHAAIFEAILSATEFAVEILPFLS